MKQPEMTNHTIAQSKKLNHCFSNLLCEFSSQSNPSEQIRNSKSKSEFSFIFRGNADHYRHKGRKILYVEGCTDKALLNKLNHIQVDIVPVVNFIKHPPSDILHKNYSSFKNHNSILSVETNLLNSYYPNRIPSHKDAIKTLVANTHNYGLIDCDFEFSLSNTPQLLYTDTHDLETLMLYTDQHILKRLGIDNTIKIRSFFMAYQLGIVRFVLETTKSNYRSFLRPDVLTSTDLTSLFCEKSFKLSLNKLQSFIKAKSANVRSNTNDDFDIIIQHLRHCGFGTDNSEWGQDIASFDYNDIENFWDIVNGHDILSLLCSLEPALDAKYHRTPAKASNRSKCSHAPNREFEMALIDSYDIECFRNTVLYDDMYELKLIA